MSGKSKQVPRPKEEWIIQGHPEMRIISDDLWEKAERRFLKKYILRKIIF